jgi:hypothetical protein
VSGLRITRPHADVWSSTELSEVYIDEAGDRLLVDLLFWVEPNGLRGACGSVTVNPVAMS